MVDVVQRAFRECLYHMVTSVKEVPLVVAAFSPPLQT